MAGYRGAGGRSDVAASEVAAPAAQEFAVENPATGEVIAHCPDLGPERDRRDGAPAPARSRPAWEALGFEGPRADPEAHAEVG